AYLGSGENQSSGSVEPELPWRRWRALTSESISDLDKPHLAIRSVGIDVSDHGLSIRVPVVETQRRARAQLVVDAGVVERCQAPRPVAGTAGKAKGQGLEGPASRIPEVVGARKAERVDVTADGYDGSGSQYQPCKTVLVVHEVEEWKTSVGARRGQELKERALLVVRRVAVAAPIEVTGP